tara:strand:- start:2383 stop:2622 length:240 start_codon:yes stop_codon:yes gene_type:complete
MNKEHDLSEIKSFLAQRGNTDLLDMLKHIEDEFEKWIDPDYSSEESGSESESESDCSMDDMVFEVIEVKKTCDGHCTIV